MAETLRSSGRVSVAVALSRVLGLVREQVFAALFGASMVADAFQVAFRVPNLLRDLFAEGALSAAFVPTFTASLVNEDRDKAYELGHLIFTALFVITGALSALGIFFAEPIVHAISNGFDGDAEKVALAASLARVMMPLLCVISLSAVWMGMLNAQRSFMAPAYAPAMFNVASVSIGGLLLLLGLGVEQGVWWWSVGTMLAGGVQLLVQLPALWRLGFRPALRLRGLFRDPRVRRIARLMGPAVVGLAAVQINVFINTRFAASLPDDGPIAQLSYAFRIFYLPIGVFSVAIATVTTTRVSEDAARGDLKALGASAAEGMSAVWMLMGASAVGLWILSVPVVELLLQRGAFDSTATLATAAVLQSYVLGLLPYGLVKILAPVFYGLDRPRIPLIASMCAVAVNITFNFLTYERFGAPGIALGTTLGAITNFIVLRVGLRGLVGPVDGPSTRGKARDIAALVLANLVMAGVVWGGWYGLSELSADWGLGGRIVRGFGLLAIVGAGFGVYVALLTRMEYPAASLLSELPSKIWRRLRPGKTNSQRPSSDESE